MGFRTRVNGKYLEEMTPEERAKWESRNKLDEMLRTGQTPHIKTDTSLFTGDNIGLGSIQDPGLIEYYKREAQAAGVNPDAARYVPELAEYPGDPRAWVRDRGEMKQVLEERGWGCEEGLVKIARPEPASAPAEPPRLAEGIVQDMVLDALAEEGVERIDMTEPANIKKIGDLREKIIDEHGRPLTSTSDLAAAEDLVRELETNLAGAAYAED